MAFRVRITRKSRLHKDLHELPFFLLKSWPTNSMHGKSTNISSLSKRPPCRNLGRSYHYCMWKDFRCPSWFSTTEFLRLIWKVEMPGVTELSIHYLTTEYNLNMKHHEKQPWDGRCRGRRPGLPHRVGNLCTLKIPWRRTWQPTPVFLPGKITWTEKPGELQTTGLQRVKRDGSNWASTHAQRLHIQEVITCIRDNSTILNYWCTF